MLTFISAKSQSGKWQRGHFTDIKGNIDSGLIRVNPSARGPIKNEGFIEFKENNKANSFKLSASDLKSFVVGRDSFVVASAPRNGAWSKNELDFVKVELNEDIKLYVAKTGKSGGSGFGFAPEVGAGIGTGGFGGGFGGGISIPIGGGGRERSIYYYGANTAEMKPLNNMNFDDVMTDIMGDYPDVVNKIHEKVYVLANIDKLIAYYKQAKATENH